MRSAPTSAGLGARSFVTWAVALPTAIVRSVMRRAACSHSRESWGTTPAKATVSMQSSERPYMCR